MRCRQRFQHITCINQLIESCRQSFYQKGYSGAVLMDLSKTFDTLNHEVLIAKLHSYALSKESLKLKFNYFSDYGKEQTQQKFVLLETS